MIVGIFSSLLATVITVMVAYLWKAGYFHEGRDAFCDRFYRRQLQSATPLQKIPQIRRRLVRKLVRDQSRKGIHFGQFGRSASISESAKYQRNPEDLSVKPRMYLTYWPGTVLQAHNLAPRAVRLAVKGVQRALLRPSRSSPDHQVVDDHLQQQFTLLTLRRAAAEAISQVALQHAHRGLRLSALAIHSSRLRAVQLLLHSSAISA